MPTTFADVVTSSYDELGIRGAGDPLSPEDLAFGLEKANRLFDAWNADRQTVYNNEFKQFNLTANHQPHTIGLAANAPDWAVLTNRPESILGANLILNNVTPNVKAPLNIVDDQWWLNVIVPDLTNSIPRDLYYSADWPNGSVYLWPVPTVAYAIQLELSLVLSQVIATTVLSLPPGYWDAIVLSVAEALQAPCLLPVNIDLMRRAAKARARVFANNLNVPRLDSLDAGMPTQGETPSRTTFNYKTRLWG